MATYILGDIHGCFETFQALLELINWTPSRDKLWYVGDLINRGPKSLDMIEWVLDHQDHIQCILGNHEVHLLACYAGASFGFGDTIEECLLSPRVEEMVEWIRRQPLIYQEGQHAMVHAGVCPLWSWNEACLKAQKIEKILRGSDGLQLLAHFHPSRKSKVKYTDPEQDVLPTWVEDLGWFTRVRTMTTSHQMYEKFKGSLDELDRSLYIPWFESYQNRVKDREDFPKTLYFGHWAALGVYVGTRVHALDSGCIWGRGLSAIRLDDGKLFQQQTIDQSLVPKNKRVSRL